MSALEKKIKEFVKTQWIEVVGLAGTERLDGSPSTDVTYTMKGARSIWNKNILVTHEKRLVVMSHKTRKRLEIKIKDSGPGIPPDEMEKIFEPLFSTKNSGVGLGLPIVKQIMNLHSGWYWSWEWKRQRDRSYVMTAASELKSLHSISQRQHSFYWLIFIIMIKCKKECLMKDKEKFTNILSKN